MTNADSSTPAVSQRRWPRRVAIGVALTGAVLGGAYWYLGRETTLQMLLQKVADASGGSIVVSGATGSLYSSMHLKRVVYRTPDQVITADNIDIDWSPWQYLSRGIAVSKLHVASLNVNTLRQSKEPAKMPVKLAPPFSLAINDARIAKVTLVNAAAVTTIGDVRFQLAGNKQEWTLRQASAITPWGQAAASASIGANKPFKLDGAASLTQLVVPAGQQPAQLRLRFGGDLVSTQLNASGQAGKAIGDARFTLAPFAPVPLRSMNINGKNINPGFFNPTLPTADLSIAISASVEENRNVSGKVDIVNDGPVGTIDKERLPLRTMRGTLAGNLSALKISDVLVDLGPAGKLTGGGALQRVADQEGMGTAQFTLRTERLDLKSLHSRMKTSAIAGDIIVTNTGATQTLTAQLAERGMRLDAKATLANNVLQISQARLLAGKGSVQLTGTADLAGNQKFKVNASASRFNPAAFGDYPVADINADINASGAVLPDWNVAADFALRPSRLFNQPLSGQGKLNANAKHVSGVDATLALGQNSLALRGSFGAPGERLLWNVNGKQLAAVRSDLYGTLLANGAITGTMEEPRTTFEVDARGLGWVREARKNADGALLASGEAWFSKPDARTGARDVNVKAKGTAQRFDPAAFGSPIAGSINGRFDTSASLSKDWRAELDLALADSTLSKAPMWGHARLSATAQRISNADVDLHVGPNLVAAKGNFGATGDRLDWRIDAPQLAAIGPGFAGALKGTGTVAGSMEAPSMTAALEGQKLRLLEVHQIEAIRASANLGARLGEATPMVTDVEVTNYVNGETRIASARLQTSGTRGAHTVRAAARGDAFNGSLDVTGGWNGGAWTGTVNTLQNTGRYTFNLQAPVPLRIAAPAGGGFMGLTRPEQIAFNGAVIRLPTGSISVQSLTKTGPRWTSKGVAAGVPLNYLAQFSEAMRSNLSGDLSLGAEWSLDLQTASATGAAPALNGMFHVFREKGDLIVGGDVPVVLGLRVLDLRTDVAAGSMRTRVNIDAARSGTATVDATTQMVAGRLGNDSPLKLSVNADMASIAWMAPLSGQPGLELDGALKLALTGGGTVGKPTLDGSVNGDKLAVRWPDQGVRLRNGQLRAQLAGDQLQLQRLSFDGVQGSAVADGNVTFAGGEASMQLKLVANQLEVLSRPDRTVVLTGESTLIRNATRFSLEGKFRADRALIELAPQGRPTMSDDVIVLGRARPGSAPAKSAPTLPLTVDVQADLGESFRLRGMGIDAQLAGQVRVRMAGGRPPRVNGGIRVASGTYAAYGQKLAIERGVLTFSGPYDNPSLNILAVRKRPEGEQLTETNVEAGVEVRGTALSPVAKLVSTPNVPDSEKLSWLVLGHGMDAISGNEAGLLSAAAGALLGGSGSSGGFQSRLANSLGVDELGLAQQGNGAGLESTVVTVGKRISSRVYLSFEQGATTASSLVRIRYKLNPRITLQFQTGTNTALDVLYSWAFD